VTAGASTSCSSCAMVALLPAINDRMKIYLAVFASVFMAELGDKTQLATLTYAASPGASPLGVFVAAAAALILSSALAVLIGSRIERCVAPAQLQLLAGLAFIGIGTWMALTR